MAIAATYSFVRASGSGLCTVTSTAHGLLVGQQYQIWAAFSSVSVASIPISATYTISVTDVNTFTFTANGAGTTTTVTGNLTWLNTGGATYSQTGTIITVTFPGNGFAPGQYAQLKFVGGSYANHDTNYKILTAPDANTLTFMALSSGGTSGGVQVLLSNAFFGNAMLSTSGGFTLVPQYKRALGPCLMTTDGRFEMHQRQCAAVGLARPAVGGQFAMVPVTRVPLGAAVLQTFGSFRMIPVEPVPLFAQGVASTGWKNLASPVLLPVMPGTPLMLMGSIAVGGNCFVAVLRTNDTVTDAINFAAKACGYLSADQMVPEKQQSLMTALNAELQTLFAKANMLDFFNQVTRTVSVPADTGQFLMDSDVQTVDGFVRLKATSRPLKNLPNMSDYERFAEVHLGPGDDATIMQAVYCNRSDDPTSAFGFSLTLCFAPKPATATDVLVNVSLCAPRYSWADYLAQTGLSIPHRYTASILFPRLAWRIGSSIDFALKAESKDIIERQYQQTNVILGLVDPTPNQAGNAAARAARIKDAAA